MALESQEQDDRPVAVRRVWELRDGEWRRGEVASVLEEPLALHINGQQAAVLMRLPGQEKELAVGFCLSEGLVRSMNDILMVHHCGQGLPEPGATAPADEQAFSRNRVELRVRPEGLSPEARLDVVRLIRAGCGGADVADLAPALEPVHKDLTVPAATLIELGKVLRDDQLLHNAVGGVHDAALFDGEGRLLALSEDVGRHNAVDKALGHCLLRGLSVGDHILLCSGRLSYEMVSKAVRMRIPLLVSISAPTALALELAERFGVTLVGYLRGQRMTVYTHPERVLTAGGAPLS
jgi:FdhD protein